MKKNYLLLALALAASVVASAQTTIYAYQTWQRGALDPKRGPVKFASNTPGDIKLISDQSARGVCYSGFYYNYKWYAQGMVSGTQSTFEGLYTIDINTGERTFVASKGSKLVDMTYDYSTGQVLGIQNGNEYLASLNIATGEVTRIAKFATGSGSNPYMIALAADKGGTLYGIATSDTLYTIDKTTAKCTPVGYTGINAAYDQTMGFDYSTGTLYWANAADATLYTLNTATGKATSIGALAHNGSSSSLGGLMIPYIDVNTGSPDRVTNRKATVDGKNVTLEWTNPSIDAQGNALTGLTSIKIVRNGQVIATVATTAASIGKEASYVDANLADGLHSYSIVPVNANGDGGVETDALQAYVGSDAPGTVSDFKVETGDNVAILQWKAPTSGQHGGAFDPSGITGYTISRKAEGSTAVTTIEINDPATTQTTDAPGFGRYTYSIAAINAQGTGTAVTTGPTLVKPASWIVMGQGSKAEVEDSKTYTFYDYSGTGYYPNNRRDTITIVPKNPNSYVKAAFTLFSLDIYGDTLKVYDGSSTNAPLYGSFSDEDVPAQLESVEASNADGALTFVFYSDVISREQGWEATITTVTKKNNDLAATDISANSYPGVGEKETYAVSIINKGVNVASGYKVQLKDQNGNVLSEADGPALQSMQAATVNLTYVHKSTGAASVYGHIEFGADDDNTNNDTKTLALTVVPAGSKLVKIEAPQESSSSLYVVPTSFMADEAISETIYPASRIGIGQGNTIEMISYPYSECTHTYKGVKFQVWVGETASDSLSSGPIAASALTKVFDGSVDITAGDASLTFPAAGSYEYKGGNLVIMVYKNAPSTSSEGIVFRGTYGDWGDAECTRFDSKYEGETGHFDPNADFGYSGSTIMADVSLLFVPRATAVETIAAPQATVKAMHGAVAVSGNGGAPLAIYAIDGTQMATYGSVTDATVSLPAGVYVVKAGTKSVKVIVK